MTDMTPTHPTQASVGEVKHTPAEIIRAWCASCGYATPSNGDCMALAALFDGDHPTPIAAIAFVVEEWEGNGRVNADAAMDRIADLLRETNHE